jgi:endonuclease III
MSASAPQLRTAKEKVWESHLRLQAKYGELELKARRDNMRELISTMLSHRTTHADEEKAYFRMLERFGSWEGVRDAPWEELVEAIGSSRFPEPKAANIKKVLARIFEERGVANIDFLQDMPTEAAMHWLMSLPGVGLKTATLVLLFNFYKPVMPVDTHVHRVTQRIGIIGPKTTAEKAHEILLDMLPREPKVLYNFHVHFLWHGQRVCVWNVPRCQQCPLTDMCDWYQTNRAVKAPPQEVA